MPAHLTYDQLMEWRAEMRESGRTVALTNGCFDLLHEGHRAYLEDAAQLADELVVAINSDAAVRALKGPGRPVTDQTTRAARLGALPGVSKVHIFDNPRVAGLVEALRPDIYVKGGDYTMETIHRDLREVLERLHIDTRFVTHVPGVSTTRILSDMSQEGRRRPGDASCS